MFSKESSAGTESLLPAISEEPSLGNLTVRNILCPVDFPEFSLRALKYAVCLSRYFGSQLYVQNTLETTKGEFAAVTNDLATHERLHTELNRAGAEVCRLADLPEVHTLVDEGCAEERILRSIKDHRIDLVVMGTHGHRGFNRFVLGSVTERIVHEATCPVLVVCRPQKDFVSPEELEPVHLKTILVAIDFSPASGHTLAYALRWASEWSGKVILLHVVEKIPAAMMGRVDLFPEYNPYFERQVAEAWATIDKLVPELANRRCEVSYEVCHGNAKEEILQFAEENKVDLIVMRSKGLGKTAVTWGSTLSGVVRDGHFPVLAVRHVGD